MMLEAYALSNPYRLKLKMGEDVNWTADDELIEDIINNVSSLIIERIGYNPKLQRYQKYFNGSGNEYLVLFPVPIQQINQLKIDDVELTENSEFFLSNSRTGVVIRKEAKFTEGDRNIYVDFYAGFSTFNIIKGYSNILNINNSDYEITTGVYNALDLATQLTDDLNDLSITVSYDVESSRFKFESDNAFSLYITADSKALSNMLGFYSNKENYTTILSEYPVLGIPSGIVGIAEELIIFNYKRLKDDVIGLSSYSKGDKTADLQFGFEDRLLSRLSIFQKRVI